MCMLQRNVVWAWHTSTFYPICTFQTILYAWACTCQQSNAYFKGTSSESVPDILGTTQNLALYGIHVGLHASMLLLHPHMSGCVGDGGEHPRGGVGDWEPAERKPASWGGRGEVLTPHGKEEGRERLVKIQCHVDLTPWTGSTLQSLLKTLCGPKASRIDSIF